MRYNFTQLLAAPNGSLWKCIAPSCLPQVCGRTLRKIGVKDGHIQFETLDVEIPRKRASVYTSMKRSTVGLYQWTQLDSIVEAFPWHEPQDESVRKDILLILQARADVSGEEFIYPWSTPQAAFPTQTLGRTGPTETTTDTPDTETTPETTPQAFTEVDATNLDEDPVLQDIKTEGGKILESILDALQSLRTEMSTMNSNFAALAGTKTQSTKPTSTPASNGQARLPQRRIVTDKGVVTVESRQRAGALGARRPD